MRNFFIYRLAHLKMECKTAAKSEFFGYILSCIFKNVFIDKVIGSFTIVSVECSLCESEEVGICLLTQALEKNKFQNLLWIL